MEETEKSVSNTVELMEIKDEHFEQENSVNGKESVSANDLNKKGETCDSVTKQIDSQENKSTSTVQKEKYSCPLCNKEFQNKSGRYNHIRLHHKVKLEFGKVHCMETGCLFSCTYTTVLQQHLTTVHNIPMKYLNLEFDSFEEFEKWKHNFETGEVCRFVKKSGSRYGNAGTSTYLYCSRSGTFVSHGKGGRRGKKLGTAKISAHCTALIKYFEESCGKVKATVCATHYGHDRDHRFLRLTKLQKRHIAEKMKSGMSRELVLDSIRSSFTNKLDRIYELSKKDLNNIQKSYKIPRQRLSDSRRLAGKSGAGAAALFTPFNVIHDSWTSDIDVSVDSPILLYKEANSELAPLKPEDKCLILMTRGQRDLFVKLCNNGVLYVTMLKLSLAFPLFLVVVFVLDDFYEMFPVCFMVANDNRADLLKVCFNQILTNVGPVSLRAFATDNQPYIFEAWCDVMGPASTSLIVANRHVDSEWRNQLSVVKNEALQGEIYDKLYDFIENAEGSEAHLRQLIAELRSSYFSTSFAVYLETNFLPTIRSWSTHYLRQLHNLREPIDFETTYSKLCTLSELCCKYNKSVAYATKGLIKLLLDLQSTRNRKVAEHVLEMANAHAASVKGGTECVFPLCGGRAWKVKSTDENGDSGDGGSRQFYEVRAERCDFDDCVLACAQCDMCVHAFRCACEAYTDSKTCVHVHQVGALCKNSVASACGGAAAAEGAERGTAGRAAKVVGGGAGGRLVIVADDRMLCCVDDDDDDDGGESLLPDGEEASGSENVELRLLRVETRRTLDDISKKLAKLVEENSLNKVHALVKDVQSNVDVLLNYGSHAKNVEFAKTSKLVKKKKKVAEHAASSAPKVAAAPAAKRPVRGRRAKAKT